MAAEQLTFQGINRAITDYSLSGACEELINLRPTTGGLVPVKPFSVKMADTIYDKVFIHNTAYGPCYIGVRMGDYGVEICLLNEDGTFNTLIDRINSGDYRSTSLEYLHMASVGNELLFSVLNEDEGVYITLNYLWDGAEYKKMEADVPFINPSVTATETTLLRSSITMTSSANKDEIVEQLNNAFSEIQETNKDYCFGPVLIAFAFRTNDGKTFWTNKWLVFDPIPYYRRDMQGDPNYYYVGSSSTQEVSDLIQRFGFVLQSVNLRRILCGGTKVRVTLPRISGWDESSSILKSVEIYVSKPILHADPTEYYSEDTQGNSIFLAPVKYEDMDLGGQLLYLQHSIPMKELASGDVTVDLKFGGNIQTTDATLIVDAGGVTRYGKLLAYNSRFHYYDSVKKTVIGQPGFSFPYLGSATRRTQVFAEYNDGQKDAVAYLGYMDLPAGAADIVVCPSLQVKRVITQYIPSGLLDTETHVYNMTPSERYNYSFAVASTESQITYYDDPTLYEDYVLTKEPSALNVSEQYNPFVFDVDHSYLAPGKILDVKPQMVAVQDVSFGDYPLNIFTDRGVYALLQGSGTVLYGNFRSISNLVSDKNSIPTESGTFFIASGGLWAIAGSKAVLISDALHLGPHKFIRRNSGYQALSNGAYDVQELESDPLFEDYVKGATLCYNRFRDEIYVSNPSYDYSYALSLKYRQWFKIAGRFMQDMPGSTIVSTKTLSGTTDILDFSDETEGTSQLVHLQSRPFSFGYMYSHIHRIVSLVRAALSTEDILIAAIYGSDDLQNWVLLSYAGRSSKNPDKPLELSQLRTPPAARSWRYYTICIGGVCPTDTDFGPVIVDYQPVIRRLG